MVKIKPKKTGFLAHFEKFFNDTPFHPDKLHPIFRQIKHFML